MAKIENTKIYFHIRTTFTTLDLIIHLHSFFVNISENVFKNVQFQAWRVLRGALDLLSSQQFFSLFFSSFISFLLEKKSKILHHRVLIPGLHFALKLKMLPC